MHLIIADFESMEECLFYRMDPKFEKYQEVGDNI